MGGGKGGSDFDPKGKSEREVMRFCQALATELFRRIGADTDVPAGDIGVGGREVGYMAGMTQKLTNCKACTFTGKGVAFQGSLMRPEATGYGVVYFLEAVLKRHQQELQGKTVLVSEAGNVAQHAIAKCLQLGAKVISVSDSRGCAHDAAGFTPEKLRTLMDIKGARHGIVEEYAKQVGAEYHAGKRPWHLKADIALPCATQNELELEDAKSLIRNGVLAVVEGANMPTTMEATTEPINAGGVAVSGLEMTQDAMRLGWTAEEVDKKLHGTMNSIHGACVKYGTEGGKTNYVNGANIAGFVKVAEAMKELGVV
ncbi:putative glutamate dehydrogenase [Trypanosoma conorhini]|uniref:glutamate dehydrogenase (NADP(+)) n=1 Tax=Trypanosoma conorhini TaxID=83891 RepID=A0A3R7M691_9TRYP|nr:putative glutamate dehydrogenase [Trypanosoma conorhini]RNF00203.1 putative glutamate dehydrogenase [Trypanosoma conorhini]